METTLLRVAVLLTASLAPGGPAWCQTYPAKPVRVIIGGLPGTAPDVIARVIGPSVSESLGQPLVLENRGGGAGLLAAQITAAAPADGYTALMAGGGSMSIVPFLTKKRPYDPDRDFTPVTLVTIAPLVIACHPALPVKSVKELIALAKARPNELNYGSSGPGGSDHIATELFAGLSGTKLTNISYKGGAPAMADLVAGHIQLMVATMAVAVGPIKGGRLRPLGVTSTKRFELMPQLPTVAEAGVPGYEAVFWFGTFVPAGTPREIVTRVNSEIRKVLQVPDVRQRLLESGLVATGSTVEEFAAFVPGESKKWAKVVQEKGIKAE